MQKCVWFAFGFYYWKSLFSFLSELSCFVYLGLLLVLSVRIEGTNNIFGLKFMFCYLFGSYQKPSNYYFVSFLLLTSLSRSFIDCLFVHIPFQKPIWPSFCFSNCSLVLVCLFHFFQHTSLRHAFLVETQVAITSVCSCRCFVLVVSFVAFVERDLFLANCAFQIVNCYCFLWLPMLGFLKCFGPKALQ